MIACVSFWLTILCAISYHLSFLSLNTKIQLWQSAVYCNFVAIILDPPSQVPSTKLVMLFTILLASSASFSQFTYILLNSTDSSFEYSMIFIRHWYVGQPDRGSWWPGLSFFGGQWFGGLQVSPREVGATLALPRSHRQHSLTHP